jgi:ABC-2 type transport system ATP-binding protein
MFMGEPAETRQTFAIEVRELSKRFRRRVAIEHLALSVRPGDICALAGANGGGKSTTLRMLAGLLAADEGEGFVLGCDLRRARHLIRSRVGYLAQRGTLYSTLSVRENLRFRASLFGLPRPASVAYEQMRSFGLTDFATIAVGRLSGGWLRQVQLAAALIHRPRLLLLDEPTVGLDPAARHAVWRTLTSLAMDDTAIVLCTHDLAEAARCSQVLLLSQGRVRARGSPEDVLRKVNAASLIVSGPRVLDLSELLWSSLVMAADPVGTNLRLLVAVEHLEVVETLLSSRGYQTSSDALTLEDAALAISHRARYGKAGAHP